MAWIQPRLIEATMHLADGKSRAVGAWGEVVARVLLERAGYLTVTNQHGSRRGDLLAINPDTGEFWRLEVKTARRGKTGAYQFCMVKDDQYGATDYRHSDAVLLLAVRPDGSVVPFLVPTPDVKTRKLALWTDPARCGGRWAGYRVTGTINLEAALSTDRGQSLTAPYPAEGVQ